MSLLNQNLQAFTAIVKHGTVHGAASELHLTQTGVTQRIRSIEKELKTTLFLRSRKGMRLTHEGEVLLHYCQAAEAIEGQTVSKLKGLGVKNDVNLTIVGPTSILNSRITDQCLTLHSKWPQLNLNFVFNDSTDRLNLVRSGRADLAIVHPIQVPNEFDSKVLKPEKYILVACKKWKGRRLADILETEKIIDFYDNDFTSINYLKKFKLLSQVKKQRLFCNNNESIIKLFIHGIGFGTLTQEVAKPYLDSNELIALNNGAVMEETLALAWYPRPEMPDYFDAIIRGIK